VDVDYVLPSPHPRYGGRGSIEEELLELRNYEMWLRSELERVRKEIEERETCRSWYLEEDRGLH